MLSSRTRTVVRKTQLATGAALVALVFGAPQLAQAQAGVAAKTSDNDAKAVSEVVVTGTLIRGVAPTGTNVVGLAQEEIAATGATNVQDLLSEVPQINNNFNNTPAPGQETGSPGNRPNIRNLGGTVGSATTLILLNGHRLVGAGSIVTTPDPGVIPTVVLERIEVVPDGGSSIYGSDAIGGVINFITRRRMDGFEVSGHMGFADNYQSYTLAGVAGKDWGAGSGYIAYEWLHHDNILGVDRDFVHQDQRGFGGTDFRTANCAPGNITAAGVTYALPARAAGTRNLCDTSLNADYYPQEERHTFYGSFTQDLSPSLTFDAHALFTRRRDERKGAPLTAASATITSANPFFTPVLAETTQTVSFDYSPIMGPNVLGYTDLREGEITAGLTKRFEGGWQLRVQGNYGQSKVLQHSPTVNPVNQTAALTSTNRATALNPYNLSATAPGILSGILNYETFFDSPKQEMAELRAVVDGAVMTLPAGDVRLAVGAEYHTENVDSSSGSVVPGSTVGLVFATGNRSVKSAFGEILIPLFGTANAGPLVQSLELSLSGRYDDYSDVGGTFNPKVGVTYRPVDWITLRANYGTSFNAPSLADTVAGVDSRVNPIANSPFIRPGDAASNAFRRTIVLAGSNPDLQPQEADTYSIGADIAPAFLPGFRASLTYYNVAFRNSIGFVPAGPVLFTPPYASFITLNPTIEQTRQILAGYRLTNVASIEELYQGTSPYLIIDARRKNLGTVDQGGLDYNLRYSHPMSFGSLDASLAGTYILSRKSTPVVGAATSDDLKTGNSRLSYIAAVGTHAGPFSARLSLNHSNGYAIVNVVNQTRVKSFNTVDLSTTYKAAGSGWMENLLLTVNIENLFDQDPPFINTAAGFTNGRTIGRQLILGVNKKF